MERPQHREKELCCFCLASAALLFTIAFLFDSPEGIFKGMQAIVYSRDALITDYFEVAGYGAAFFNAGLMMLVSMGIIHASRLPYSGVTLMAVFMNMSFAFWGKNPVNAFPIVFGTWCYARFHKIHFARVAYTAIFATCLAPFVSELVYILPFSVPVNLIIAVCMGVLSGYVMPPLATHTASMHMGYSLFNVGFSGGILAFVAYSVLKAMGIQSETVFLWRAEKHMGIIAGMFLYFIVTFLIGFWLSGGDIKGLRRILDHPGRAVADFVMMDGAGTTLMNMGILGMAAECYILLIGVDFSGPVIGGILTVFAFGAFGAHIKNYLPVLSGVYLSTLFSVYEVGSPSIIIAALFCVGIAPIAGEFGVVAGIVAGMLHVAVVTCTSQLYGGLNLYNNGFAAGFVAIIMVPLIESGIQRAEKKRREQQEKRRVRS